MPKGEPIDQGVISRAIGAVQGAIKGARDAWFGPGDPPAPIPPPEVKGRQFDFPVAWNVVTYKPRTETGENGIDFDTLRALADPVNGGLDLLRLAIETRKDQMAGQKWVIKGRDGSDGGNKARAIEQAMRKPDLVNTFGQWQRMLVEDLLVIDAPTVYPAPSTLGYRIPQVMDGALLKPLLSEDGRTPLPPEPAYQQVLKGVPAAQYSLDEIVRMPRNLRSHRVYGMSPVEQVVMTVSIALRRQLSQLEHYTAGSVPDAVANCPPEWSAAMIKEFQFYWDSILSGNTEERRRLRFIPGGVGVNPLRPDQLKDMFDEWLARIICFCFSLSPQALVKEMNRATAQTSKESAQEQGLEPLKEWWKDYVDEILAKCFDAPELELAYADEEIADPEVKADVMATSLGKGGGKPWFTQDEVRAAYGKQPMTAEQRLELQPPAPTAPKPGTAGNDGNGGSMPSAEPGKDAGKVAKRGRVIEFHRDEKGVITGATLR